MAQFNYNSNEDSNKFRTYKYGSGTIAVAGNIYTVNTATTGDRMAEVQVRINGVSIGDLVTIEADVNAVGTLTSALVVADTEATITTHAVAVNGVYKSRSTFAITKPGDVLLAIGGGWNLDLSGTISNIAITVQSATGAFVVDNNPKIQRFTIQATATGTFSLRDDWSLNAGTLSNLDANTLKIALAVKPTHRYQGFTNEMSAAGSLLYRPRIDVDPYNNVLIKFYDMTNTVVPLANVSVNTYVGILLF